MRLLTFTIAIFMVYAVFLLSAYAMGQLVILKQVTGS